MQAAFIEKNFRFIQGMIFIIGLSLSLLYAENQILTGDQTQMLFKGYLGAYQGNWLPFGNAASAVGNVPGFLSAWLVGVPLLIWDNPWAPMLLIIALRIASLILLDNVIKQVFGIKIRLLFIVLYWLNPWFLYDSLIYNPAYLCFFTALHFWTAFKLRKESSFIYSLLHVLSIGAVMQLHYSWPVLAIISCFLLYRKMSKPAWLGVITALALLFISLIPYFLEYRVNESIGNETDRYIGYGLVHVYPVLKAVLYWLRYGSTLFSNRVITDVSFDWVSQIYWIKAIFSYSWQSILFVFGAFTLVLSAKINWQSYKKVKAKLKRNEAIANDKDWLLLLTAASVIAIVMTAMLSPITFSYWHLILIFPIAVIPIVLFVDDADISNSKRYYNLLAALAVFFIVVNLVAANDSDKFSYKVSYEQQVNQYLTDEDLVKM